LLVELHASMWAEFENDAHKEQNKALSKLANESCDLLGRRAYKLQGSKVRAPASKNDMFRHVVFILCLVTYFDATFA